MHQNATVHFRTENRKEIPQIGQRKRVRLNGKAETKYVAKIEMRCVQPGYFAGSYLLTDHDGLFNAFG